MVKYFNFIHTYLISWSIVWNIYFSSNIFKSTIGTSIFVAGTTTTSSTWKSYGIVVMADHYDYKKFLFKNMWCWILFEEGLMEYSAKRTTIVQAFQKPTFEIVSYIIYVLCWVDRLHAVGRDEMTNLATESALLFDPRLKPIMITIMQMISPNSFVVLSRAKTRKKV